MRTIPSNARHFPATRRNREPICEVLSDVLPERGMVLEIASGSGEHILFFAEKFPHLDWQPSDPDPLNLESIRAWRNSVGSGLPNLFPPMSINASDIFLPLTEAAAILCINMIHIAPSDATAGLLRNAAALLSPGGILYLYGPFMIDGRHTAPSNEAFDLQLRRENPAWGVRDLHDVVRDAKINGLELLNTVAMPANNMSVIFSREG